MVGPLDTALTASCFVVWPSAVSVAQAQRSLALAIISTSSSVQPGSMPSAPGSYAMPQQWAEALVEHAALDVGVAGQSLGSQLVRNVYMNVENGMVVLAVKRMLNAALAILEGQGGDQKQAELMSCLNPHSGIIMAGCEALAAATIYDLLKHRTPVALIRAAADNLAASPHMLVPTRMASCEEPTSPQHPLTSPPGFPVHANLSSMGSNGSAGGASSGSLGHGVQHQQQQLFQGGHGMAQQHQPQQPVRAVDVQHSYGGGGSGGARIVAVPVQHRPQQAQVQALPVYPMMQQGTSVPSQHTPQHSVQQEQRQHLVPVPVQYQVPQQQAPQIVPMMMQASSQGMMQSGFQGTMQTGSQGMMQSSFQGTMQSGGQPSSQADNQSMMQSNGQSMMQMGGQSVMLPNGQQLLLAQPGQQILMQQNGQHVLVQQNGQHVLLPAGSMLLPPSMLNGSIMLQNGVQQPNSSNQMMLQNGAQSSSSNQMMLQNGTQLHGSNQMMLQNRTQSDGAHQAMYQNPTQFISMGSGGMSGPTPMDMSSSPPSMAPVLRASPGFPPGMPRPPSSGGAGPTGTLSSHHASSCHSMAKAPSKQASNGLVGQEMITSQQGMTTSQQGLTTSQQKPRPAGGIVSGNSIGNSVASIAGSSVGHSYGSSGLRPPAVQAAPASSSLFPPLPQPGPPHQRSAISTGSWKPSAPGKGNGASAGSAAAIAGSVSTAGLAPSSRAQLEEPDIPGGFGAIAPLRGADDSCLWDPLLASLHAIKGLPNDPRDTKQMLSLALAVCTLLPAASAQQTMRLVVAMGIITCPPDIVELNRGRHKAMYTFVDKLVHYTTQRLKDMGVSKNDLITTLQVTRNDSLFFVNGDCVILKLHQMVGACIELSRTPHADLPFPPTLDNLLSTPMHDQSKSCFAALQRLLQPPTQEAFLTACLCVLGRFTPNRGCSQDEVHEIISAAAVGARTGSARWPLPILSRCARLELNSAHQGAKAAITKEQVETAVQQYRASQGSFIFKHRLVPPHAPGMQFIPPPPPPPPTGPPPPPPTASADHHLAHHLRALNMTPASGPTSGAISVEPAEGAGVRAVPGLSLAPGKGRLPAAAHRKAGNMFSLLSGAEEGAQVPQGSVSGRESASWADQVSDEEMEAVGQDHGSSDDLTADNSPGRVIPPPPMTYKPDTLLPKNVNWVSDVSRYNALVGGAHSDSDEGTLSSTEDSADHSGPDHTKPVPGAIWAPHGEAIAGHT